jgi:hypothetical protein
MGRTNFPTVEEKVSIALHRTSFDQKKRVITMTIIAEEKRTFCLHN